MLASCKENEQSINKHEWGMNTSQTSQHNKQKKNKKERQNTKAMQKHARESMRVWKQSTW